MIVCQRCGRENDGRYRFCLGCGAALPAARTSGASVPPPVPAGIPPAPSAAPSGAAPVSLPPHPGTAPLGRSTAGSAGQVPLAPLPRRGTAAPPPPVGDDDATSALQLDDIEAEIDAQLQAAARSGAANAPPPSSAPAVPRPAARMPSAAAAPPVPAPGRSSAPQALLDPAGAGRVGSHTSMERGEQAPPDILKCVQCSNVIPPSYAFCGVCGTARSRSEAAARAPAAPAREAGFLALIDDLGNESVRHRLISGENRIGRSSAAEVCFDQDGLLAQEHCVLSAGEQPFKIRPIDLYNGTYLRISTPVELHHGDIVRVGQEVLRFERIEDLSAEVSPITGRPLNVGCAMPRGVWGRLCQVGMARQVANAYLLSHRDVFLGRERGDILFPRDGFVSGSHAVISERGGRVYLKDLGSSNGTFLRIKREITLRNGDLLLLGRNLLRVHVGAPA